MKMDSLPVCLHFGYLRDKLLTTNDILNPKNKIKWQYCIYILGMVGWEKTWKDGWNWKERKEWILPPLFGWKESRGGWMWRILLFSFFPLFSFLPNWKESNFSFKPNKLKNTAYFILLTHLPPTFSFPSFPFSFHPTKHSLTVVVATPESQSEVQG